MFDTIAPESGSVHPILGPVLDPTERVVHPVVARFAAAVDDLLDLALVGLSRDDLLGVCRDVETQRRRLPAGDHRVIAELSARGVAAEVTVRDTRTLLAMLLRIDPAEAGARVRAAEDLGPRRGVTGQVLGPLFPAAAAALAAGEVSERHGRVITATIDALPDAVTAVYGGAVEEFLTTQARILDPRGLTVVARRVRDTLDPDGTLSDPADHERRRDVRLTARPDGTGTITGTLTPWLLAGLRAVLDPLARPHPATPGEDIGSTDAGAGGCCVDGAGDTGSRSGHGASGTMRDPRRAGQRYHDALQAVVDRVLRSGTLPDSGGTPATILLTLTPKDLTPDPDDPDAGPDRTARTATGTARTGTARTGTGTVIPVSEVLRHTGDAVLVPLYLTDTGTIRGLGHTRRFATPAQRLVLAGRDRGCSHPGCDIPPDWCQTHHVTPWRTHRRTRIEDLTLVCTFHHLTAIPLGWDCVMIGGIPHWKPPAFLDTDRTPQRNTTHHLDQIVFHPPDRPEEPA